jgi:hypothetical protein
MQRTKPPFRADHVGSLLRSATLKEARAKRERGEITPEQLKAVEDREIDALIKKQEATGLKSITDGENRRKSWQTDFISRAARHRDLSGQAQGRLPGRRAAAAAPRPRRAQARRIRYASDDRAFQVLEGAHQGHGEDDHPVTVRGAFPRRP